MDPLMLIVPLMFLAVAAIRLYWRLREKLKRVDGWREKWQQTIKWVTFDGATTFDHGIMWAVLTGRLSKSSEADIRRDAGILRVLMALLLIGAIALVGWR